MIKQSVELSVAGSHGEPFVADATATVDGVRVVVSEKLGGEQCGADAWSRLQESFCCDVFVKEFTWEQFSAFSSLGAAGMQILAENEIYQWV